MTTPLPTVCLTFDEWNTTFAAAQIMSGFGLAGTFFANVDMIDTPGGYSMSQINLMRMWGWEIGGYPGSFNIGGASNMVTLLSYDRNQAAAKLRDVKNAFWAKGIPVTTFAPNQRAWSDRLAGLADGIFTHVRSGNEEVATVGHYQGFPLPNPLYVKGGGTNSFGSTDTGASLSATIDDLIAVGDGNGGPGAWITVIHRVSDDGTNPLYTVSVAAFTALCAKIKAEVDAGNLRCVRFKDL